jgi:YbgC/YbaW family acyl-CoA thioester hydrolase
VAFTRDELTAAGPGWSERRTVRFQDVDAAGIVFYPRFLEYFHDVYVAFLTAHGWPLHAALRDGKVLAPLKHAEVDFFRPLRFGDEIDVAIVRAAQEGSVLTVGFRVSRPSGEPIAVGHAVHVFVDASFQRTEIPEPVCAGFQTLR